METLEKTLIIPARQRPVCSKNILNNVPVRRNAIAMNKNFTFTGSVTKNPFRYQPFKLRPFRIFRGCHPNVNVDAAENCRLDITTIKAMNVQDDVPSIPIDNFKDQFVLWFDLVSMQDATENCPYWNYLENH